MKSFLLLVLITNSAFAATLTCRGDNELHYLRLDLESNTFSFLQSCWNPCNSGEGEIVYGPNIGWAGIMYSLDLNRSNELITPMTSRKLMLFLEHGQKTGTLSDATGKINVTCSTEE